MSLFGFLGQQQPDPTSPDTNPYTSAAQNVSPIARFLGMPGALENQARFAAQSQAWQAAHDYANRTGAYAPPLQGDSASLSVTDGTTATAPASQNGVTGAGAAPGADYTSSPGPMDQIAANAQFGKPFLAGSPPQGVPATGGTSLVNTGPAPQVPSYDQLNLPQSRQQTASDALRLAAAGADPAMATTNYDWANPASRVDATPQYMQGQNGEWYRVQNGQFTQVKAPDQKFIQYTDQMGVPHAGYIPVPAGATGANPGTGGAPTQQASPNSQPPMIGGRPGGAPVTVTPPPLSNNEAVQALQVALAEDPKNPQGILSTIVNRAAATGKSINEVLQEPGQFEVVANGRAAKIPAQQAIQLFQNPGIQSIFAGNIPAQYAGVTQFYSPGAQAALGRKAPSWDDGSGFDVGQTRFFARPFEGNQVPMQQASGSGASGPPMVGAPAGGGGNTPGGFQEVALPGSGNPGGQLDPQTQSLVDAIGQGRMAPLTLSGKSPRNGAIMAAVQAQYPTYDADAWKMRQDTTKNFFNGPAGKQLGSLNTAIEHLGSLAGSVDQVNNGNNPAAWNALGNWLQTGIPLISDQKKQGDLNALDLNIQGALHEAMSAYKTAGGSEGEFNGLTKDLDVNGSRQAQYIALQKVAQMLDGKRQQLLEQYQNGMGGNVPLPAQLLDPNADAVQAKIDAGAAGLRSQPPQIGQPSARSGTAPVQLASAGAPPMRAVAPTAQAQRLSPQQAATLPSGTQFVGLDGVTRVKH